MKKRLVILTLLGLMPLSMFGCSSNKVPEEVPVVTVQNLEINQNDYRGAYMRVNGLKNKINEVVQGFNSIQNDGVISVNPSNYWNSDNFIYFTNNFLDTELFDYTQYFNETETEWQEAYNYTEAQFYDENGNPTVNGLKIEHTDLNKYLLSFDGKKPRYAPNSYDNFKYDLNCTYNGNYDWLQFQTITNSSTTPEDVCTEMVEYARRGNTFLVQTATERLMVTYKDLGATNENASNPIEKSQIESFSYSKLSGKTLPKYNNENLIEEIETNTDCIFMSVFEIEPITEDGELTDQYNPSDTLFTHIDDITDENWVREFPIEEGFYQTYITFDGTDMTIYNYNELADRMEVIEFKSDGTIQDDIVNLTKQVRTVEQAYITEDGLQTGTLTLLIDEFGNVCNDDKSVMLEANKCVFDENGYFVIPDGFMGIYMEKPEDETEESE